MIELPSKSERAAYLREACGDDAWLRQNVEELLRGRFAADNSITPQQAVDPIPPGFVMSDLYGRTDNKSSAASASNFSPRLP